MLPQTLIGLLIGFLYKIWSSTFRYHLYFENPADKPLFFLNLESSSVLPKKNLIFACFHQDDMSCIPYFANKGIGVLVSASKDGRMLAAALEHFGYVTIRGSSHRRAVAGLLSAIRLVREGHKFTIAVDGPRGPLYQVKEGITHLAEKTGCLIVPVKAHPHCAFVFKKSWSQTALPLPFTRVDILIGSISSYTAATLEAKMRSMTSARSIP